MAKNPGAANKCRIVQTESLNSNSSAGNSNSNNLPQSLPRLRLANNNSSSNSGNIIINPMEQQQQQQQNIRDPVPSASSGQNNNSNNGNNNAYQIGSSEANQHYDPTAASSPVGTESPGTSQMSPPPSYNEIPGTVRPLNRDILPPSYEDAVDPNGEPPSYDSLFGRILDTHKASRNMADFLLRLIVLLIGTIGCTIACSVTVVIPVAMIIIGAVHFDDCPAEPYIPVFLIVGGTFLVAKYIIGVAARFRQGRRQLERQQQQQQHQQQQEMQQVHPCDREAGVGDNRDPIRGATVHVFEEGGGGGSVSSSRDDERDRRRGRRRNTSSDDGDGDQGEEEVDPLQSIISCFLCAWFITGCVWVYRIYEPVMDPALSGDPHYCDATVYVFAFWFITTAYIFLGLVTSCICCISIYAQTRTEREQ